jgi:DNA polymerase (family 10)
MMKNIQLSWIFSEIADILEIKSDNPFKVKAYRKAAHTLYNLPFSLELLNEKKKLKQLSGIGSAIADKIMEYMETGEIMFHQKLKTEIPVELIRLLKIPGLGPKKIQVIRERLDINNVDDLYHAAKARKIRELPGMSAKTELNILKGIEMISERRSKTPLGTVLPFAEAIVSVLKKVDGVQKVEISGSIRRLKEEVKNIDILAVTTKPKELLEVFFKIPWITEVMASGETKASVLLDIGIQVDLRIIPPKSFPAALQYFTGSKEHNVKLRGIAKSRGLKLNEYGIFKEDGKCVPVKTEQDIYDILGLNYIIPELREDRGEIEASANNCLPKIIDKKDVKGDLHLHTCWSDGGSTIQELADKARSLGYEYMAVTDHSKSLTIARGIDENKLKQQRAEIDELNKNFDDFKILAGIEMDILRDARLDFDDNVLKDLDIVIASIHSGFRQDRDQITERILNAIKNENVDIIAHPTGRMLSKRNPYAVDIDQIFEAAAKTGTVLEINSSPDRLDLNDVLARKAKECGIKLAINTDAHEAPDMEKIRFGVGVARRAWLEKDDIINCMDYDSLIKFLK